MDNLQKIYGYMRNTCVEFDLIQEGDKIAAAVSGGKDSVVLLAGLAGLRRFYPKPFQLIALTIDPRFDGKDEDYGEIESFCKELDVPFKLVRTDIGQIVFDVRKEPNPCSLCAKMRRGALHDAAKAEGCNKLALGHHNDDAVETFVMNLFHEGRVGCFAPKSYLSRKDITVIRPLVLAPEKLVAACHKQREFPLVKSRCPADKNTVRQKTKEWLAMMEKQDRGFKARLFGALRRSGVDGWGFKATPHKDCAEDAQSDFSSDCRN